MIGSKELAIEKDTMGTMVELTSAFEGIASAHIAQIREQVLQSEQFFADLWRIYSQLRVDGLFRFGRGQKKEDKVIDKELLILVTSEGSFSGDIEPKGHTVYQEFQNSRARFEHQHPAYRCRSSKISVHIGLFPEVQFADVAIG
jgi:F0F1-type ATP synthase gamma subunit